MCVCVCVGLVGLKASGCLGTFKTCSGFRCLEFGAWVCGFGFKTRHTHTGVYEIRGYLIGVPIFCKGIRLLRDLSKTPHTGLSPAVACLLARPPERMRGYASEESIPAAALAGQALLWGFAL